MAAVAAANPADVEAQIFYALSIAASHTPSDKTYANLLKAAGILEGLIEKYPQHPGLAHYIIHSYDVPALADRALVAARRYATIAPSAPHALHMPSHTFTRVGSWQESIDTNIASANSARALGATAEELHAMDYQAYAALQTGQDAVARELVAALPGIKARFDPDAIGGAAPGVAGLFAMASIPARYALERGDWKAAAALTPEPSRFLYPEAQTWYAKALGAARSGDAATTQAAIAELTRIRDELTAKKETYWAEQAEIQRRSATAWLALVEGRHAEALTEMQAAARCRGQDREGGGDAGPAGAGARAGRRDAAADGQAGRGAAGIRGDAGEGAEPVPRAVGRDPGGDAGRPDGQGAPARPDAAGDLREGGRAGAPRARRRQEARLVGVAVAGELLARASGPARAPSRRARSAPATRARRRRPASARVARRGGWRS